MNEWNRLLFIIFLWPQTLLADLIAYDFTDLGSLNLEAYSNPYQDGFTSNSDIFAIYTPNSGQSIANAFLDDLHYTDVSNVAGTALPLANSDSAFFAISDTYNSDTQSPVVAQWQFGVSGNNLSSFSLDVAASGDFENSDYFALNYWLDDDVAKSLFSTMVTNTSIGHLKIFEQEIDHVMQTFEFEMSGQGSILNIELVALANGGQEFIALDNFQIYGETIAVSEPKLTLMFSFCLALLLLHQRRKNAIIKLERL